MATATVMGTNMARSRRARNATDRQRGWRWPSPARIALALGALLAAIPVSLATTSLVESRNAADVAVLLWPWNSLALGQIAGTELSVDTAAADRLRISSAARRALMIEPGNVRAARSLAVLAGLSGNERMASLGLRYSETLSRRDLLTQLALIEWRVQQNDVVGALRHYDRALRATQSIPLLLSTMIKASADPVVRGPVIDLLRQRPRWRSAFLVQLIDEQTPADTVYGIVSALRLDPARPDERQVLAGAIGKLIGLGHVADARRLLPPSATPVRNGNFEAENPFPPLDWMLADDANLNAVIEGDPRGGGRVLYLDARNGRGGDLASQRLSLSPGQYRLSLVIGDATAVRPQVAIVCDDGTGGGGEAPLLSMTVPTAPITGARAFSQPFRINGPCVAQRLVISLPTSLDEGAPRPWIDDVAVTQVQ